MTPLDKDHVLALCGGVGGAKLALGLAKVVAPERLTIVANTGDDFQHLGLYISPDLDTVMYTLAGLADPETGWGRREESWSFLAALEELGSETWFRLGDRDLATHVERTRRLNSGESLSQVTATLCRRLGVGPRLWPMSDQPVPTTVLTPDGPLAFQHYFVRERCRPKVTGFRFQDMERATPSPGFQAALEDPALAAVVICPSNPFISVDPILSLPGARSALADGPAPVVAVSPIVGGQAIKGPTAKMMHELGIPATAVEVASHYGELLDGFVLDTVDTAAAPHVRALGMVPRVSSTLMVTVEDKVGLATEVLEFAATLAGA